MRKLEPEINQESNSGNLSPQSVPVTFVLKCLFPQGRMGCPEDSEMGRALKVMDKPVPAEEVQRKTQ